MVWVKWIIIAVAAAQAGWMLFDGSRALVVGDYVTPRTGAYAGELGPWAGLVEAAGVPARSALMKWIFVVYGAAWLGVVVGYAAGAPWAWWAMLAAAAGSLWYLPVGTVLAAVQIALLVAVRRWGT